VSELAAVVPFGLLPADDPRMRALAQGLLWNNVAGDEANMLTRWAPDPSRATGGIPVPSGSQGAAPSSLAPLWMARYLIRLGRETGEGRHWNRALALVDTILSRLGPLGLILCPEPRGGEDVSSRAATAPGVWGLHAMLIETLLDIGGLDYD